MSILKKRNILKLAATFMLVGMMAGIFIVHSSTASAAGPCAPTNTIAVGDTCTLLVSATDAGTLLFSNDATVAVGAVSIGLNSFAFASTVIDSRTAPTGGWRLQATSPGLVSGANSIPLTIGDTGSSCSINAAACAGFVATPITLPNAAGEATAQPFATEDTTNDGGGTFTLSTHGHFTVANTTPGGSYSATITLSLLNTFA